MSVKAKNKPKGKSASLSPVESMTGISELTGKLGSVQMLCRIRSVNHRFLDLKVRLPKTDSIQLDSKVRKLLSEKINRGSVELSLNIVLSKTENKLQLNEELARQYLDAAHSLAQKLKLKRFNPSEMTIEKILDLPGVLLFSTDKGGESEPNSFNGRLNGLKDEEILEKLIAPAISKLLEDRSKEGLVLTKHLLELCHSLEIQIGKIKKLAPEQREKSRLQYLDRITQTVEFLAKQNSKSDSQFESRLNEEASFFIERKDFEEEQVRFGAHLNQFQNLVRSKERTAEGIGRKLEFIAQEMLREVNTLGTKAGSIEITNCTIEMKTLIERIKEQIANVA